MTDQQPVTHAPPMTVDLTGLPDAQAFALGHWTGEAIAAAEARGHARAVAQLRDHAAWCKQEGLMVSAQAFRDAADYLEAQGATP